MTTDDVDRLAGRIANQQRTHAEIMGEVALRLFTALEATGVALMAYTDFPPDHSWVCRPDDLSVQWCQWCGVHLVEVKAPGAQCPALVLVREALS